MASNGYYETGGVTVFVCGFYFKSEVGKSIKIGLNGVANGRHRLRFGPNRS